MTSIVSHGYALTATPHRPKVSILSTLSCEILLLTVVSIRTLLQSSTLFSNYYVERFGFSQEGSTRIKDAIVSTAKWQHKRSGNERLEVSKPEMKYLL